MARVFGFDESSFARAQTAIRRVMRTPRSGSRQRRQAPVLGGSSGNGGTTLTDGCECNPTFATEGVTLFGAPEVCCKGHQRWTLKLEPVLGNFTLYHVSGDTWSTYHDDEGLDNPYVVTCGEGESAEEDEYDLVMVLTSTGSTITLVPRDELNCDPVCFQYVRSDLFACQSANQFKRGYFENAKSLKLPLCVCVVPAAGNQITCANRCDVSDTLPEVIEVSVSGVVEDSCCEGASSFCCGQPGCEVRGDSGSCNTIPGCPDKGTVRSCSAYNGAHQMTFTGDCQWVKAGDPENMIPTISLQLNLDPLLTFLWGPCNVCNAATTAVTLKSSSLIGNTEPLDCSQPIVFDTVFGAPSCPVCNLDNATAIVTFPGVNPPEGSGHCSSPCAPEE